MRRRACNVPGRCEAGDSADAYCSGVRMNNGSMDIVCTMRIRYFLWILCTNTLCIFTNLADRKQKCWLHRWIKQSGEAYRRTEGRFQQFGSVFHIHVYSLLLCRVLLWKCVQAQNSPQKSEGYYDSAWILFFYCCVQWCIGWWKIWKISHDFSSVKDSHIRHHLLDRTWGKSKVLLNFIEKSPIYN